MFVLVEYGGPPFLENTAFPLDTSVGTAAATSPASTGSLTTNYANDVLVAGGTISGSDFASTITNCGSGCSLFTEIHPIAPFFDVVVDAEVTTAPGPYQAQVNTNGGGNWVMQMIALRVAGQTTIVNPAPTATSVVPATSGETGGVPIVITGTNFLAGANAVISDGTFTASAVNCAVANSTTMNCVSPDFPTTHSSPTIVVTNPDNQATTGLGFAYTSVTPFTTTAGVIGPNGGSVNGGTPVNITGSDFAAGATVKVGTTPADKVLVINSGLITAVMPAGPAADQTVVVKNPSGASATAGTFGYASGAGINFVQANSARAVSAPFTLAQAAGDLNVVVIGWGDTTSTITSVTDSAGNTYAPAVAPTQGTGLTQAIYYAKNIKASAANTNTVTVDLQRSA